MNLLIGKICYDNLTAKYFQKEREIQSIFEEQSTIEKNKMNSAYADMLKTLKVAYPDEIPPYEPTMQQTVKDDLKSLAEQIATSKNQIDKLQTQINNITSTQNANLPDNVAKKNKLLFLKTKQAINLDQYYRIKRFMLIYHNQRLNKIQNQFWQFSGNLKEQVKVNLSENQKNYFKDYKALATQYIEDSGLELTLDLDPPIDPSVEVRFLKDCGEILSDDGQPIKLEMNVVLYIKKRLIQNFIKDGRAQIISSSSN